MHLETDNTTLWPIVHWMGILFLSPLIENLQLLIRQCLQLNQQNFLHAQWYIPVLPMHSKIWYAWAWCHKGKKNMCIHWTFFNILWYGLWQYVIRQYIFNEYINSSKSKIIDTNKYHVWKQTAPYWWGQG